MIPVENIKLYTCKLYGLFVFLKIIIYTVCYESDAFEEFRHLFVVKAQL